MGNKVYSLINASSGKALDIYRNKNQNGVAVIQFPYKASSDQQFRFADLNNGYWSLKAMHCIHAVDVASQQQEVYGDDPG